MMAKGAVATHDANIRVSLCVDLWNNYQSPTVIVGDNINEGDILSLEKNLGEN